MDVVSSTGLVAVCWMRLDVDVWLMAHGEVKRERGKWSILRFPNQFELRACSRHLSTRLAHVGAPMRS